MGRLLFRLGSLTARHAVMTLVAWALLAIAIVGLVHIYGAKTNNNLSLPGTMVVLLAPAILTLFRDRIFWMPRIIERIVPHVPIEGERTPSPQPSEEETTA